MSAWIVVADGSRARVFCKDEPELAVRRVRELKHLKSRMKGSAMTTDRPGRIGKMAPRRSAMDRHTPAKQVEAEHFAQELAHVLRTAHARGEFEDLAVVAPAHFLGILRRALGRKLRDSIVVSAGKDLTQVNERELAQPLRVVLNALRRAQFSAIHGCDALPGLEQNRNRRDSPATSGRPGAEDHLRLPTALAGRSRPRCAKLARAPDELVRAHQALPRRNCCAISRIFPGGIIGHDGMTILGCGKRSPRMRGHQSEGGDEMGPLGNLPMGARCCMPERPAAAERTHFSFQGRSFLRRQTCLN